MNNPLELRGPEFLEFYTTLLVGVGLTALAVRWLLRWPGKQPGEPVPDLSPYEVAYLSGGPDLALHAALASLAHRRVLAVQPTERKVSVQGPLPSRAYWLEQQICNTVGKEGQTVAKVRAATANSLEKLRKRLQEEGLVPATEWNTTVGCLPALLLFAVTLLGLVKIAIGLDRNRPVGFLIVLTALSVMLAIVFLVKRPLRSRRGDQVLAQLKADNGALRATAGSSSDRLAGDDLVLALGLFGLGVVATGVVADLRLALKPPLTAGSSGWGISCGGSSCGGGGGCGGGCGGGGCGGCGS